MKNKIEIQQLLFNKKFLPIFSIVLAFIIWLAIAMIASPEIERVVEDVKVTIDLTNSVPAQFNLQVFGEQEFTVDVTVRGKRYIVGANALSADDILVTPQMNYVDSSGKHTLQLKATTVEENADFVITGLSEDFIEVYFDVYKEAEYTLQADIVADKIIPDGYIMEKEVLSLSSVIVSGPAAEINKIDKVVARVKLESPLTKTDTFKAEIIPLNQYGGSLRYLTINNGIEEITMTIPVLMVKELPITVSFKNAPEYYLTHPLSVTATPSRAVFAAPKDVIEDLTSISIGTIDFHGLGSIRNSYSFKTSSIPDAKVVGGPDNFNIVVDATNMTSSKITVKESNISILNVPQGASVSLAQKQIENVSIVGPKDAIAALSANGAYAEIDLSGVTLKSGLQSVPAKVVVKSNTTCWAYGNYRININATLS